jgi:AcrR family transcriptional regulator
LINQKDNIETEEKVLEAARDIFQKKGFFGARMDEIANRAGVNKALLHYYFRSKEKLFDKIFQEALGEFIHKVVSVLNGDLPLDVKIYRTVDMYSNMLSHNRDLPLFVLSTLQENPDLMIRMIKGGQGEFLPNLSRQLQHEYEEGNITNLSTHEFFINLVSLTIFPFLVQPVLMGAFNLEEEDFKQMINERRKKVPKMIIEILRP